MKFFEFFLCSLRLKSLRTTDLENISNIFFSIHFLKVVSTSKKKSNFKLFPTTNAKSVQNSLLFLPTSSETFPRNFSFIQINFPLLKIKNPLLWLKKIKTETFSLFVAIIKRKKARKILEMIFQKCFSFRLPFVLAP